ncbi:hypothetical protein [Sphingobacterium gobiense]|uniref:Uncharacterized protein n=1 Tax=Sphingobacterium gobiense TaxID=1382456 RepID=A0A2S9JTG9_9SPHI|nr:hypothetical protein [Sphingobacterium gobiense]PRD56498.1 hypothetical protein C5749_04445 [Sphingobacterium gobiense]
MEEQNSMLPPDIAGLQDGSKTKNEKLIYLAPAMGSILVELENNIAAGSITVKETEGKVEEGWMVEDDVVREIDIDLF